MNDDKIVSLSGAPVHTYPEERSTPFALALGDVDLITAIDRHIQAHVGPVSTVFHEIISDQVHLDVHVVAATHERPYHVLITSGMSAIPMVAPEGAETCRFLELFLVLPASWPLDANAWKDSRWYWPIRELKTLARFPHLLNTWIWYGHTVQNPDAAPFDPSVSFNAAAIGPTHLVNTAFCCMTLSDAHVVVFLPVHFLYPEELQFKLRHGADALFDRMTDRGISELVAPHRKNTCRRWWPAFQRRT
jgi:hypothetical protein